MFDVNPDYKSRTVSMLIPLEMLSTSIVINQNGVFLNLPEDHMNDLYKEISSALIDLDYQKMEGIA